MYLLLWLNTVGAVQMFFIERIFVFFMTLFLKKMGIIISASKCHCHSRLSKPILKIESIEGVFQENNFPKQYALNTFSDYFYEKAAC